MSPNAAGADPFGLTPDTGAYVPRQATEQALGELVAALQGRGPAAVILGGAGVGKTLLLHLLAERIGPGLQSVYLPNSRLTPFELCTWIARRIGAPAGEDAEPFLRAWFAHLGEQDQGCLLLVDDADAMPLATVRWLAAFAAESRGGLRLAVAALTGPAADRVARALGDVRRVELDAAMSPTETAEYVGWRLARADVPEAARARFDAPTVDELHRVAGGNPRRLHLAVESLARGGSIAVLEDEIAEHAAPPPEPPPAPARAVDSKPSVAPAPDPEPEAAPPPRDASTSAERPPRRRLAGVLLAAGGAAALAGALLLRAPEGRWPAPTAGSAQTTPAAAPLAPAQAPASTGEDLASLAAGPATAPVAPTRGPLRVNLNAVPWARVEVDGIDLGETPLAGVPLRPGPHTFRAEYPDGRVVERTVEIDESHRHLVFE